jgi:hypothetical protein
MWCPFARCALIAAALHVPGRALAQSTTTDSASARFILIGSPAEDRRRIGQLFGRASTASSLLRTSSALADTAPLPGRELRIRLVAPSMDLTWNSQIPFSMNDGAQWAGRGWTTAVQAGVVARMGRVSVHFVPQIWRASNTSTPVLPPGDASRKGFSSPWQVGPLSADLPLRLGYKSTTALDFGESAVWFTGGRIATGLSTESQWWGPGIRNALIMSNNAGGIPHAFLRTAAPLRTRFGALEGRWIIGALSESRFFDVHVWNNLRSVSGLVASFSPAVQPGLTAGIARVVYANIRSASILPARAFDVFLRDGKASDVSPSDERAAEQLTSLFGRWVFPASRSEVYAEWSRVAWPASLRSLLVAPQYTQGFTVGAQFATPETTGSHYRFQAEFTNLEQSPTSKQTNNVSFYTSLLVPQGYTQRGQVVGAAIGPGSSSQWLAADRLADAYDVGAFVGRIRWNTDAYYTRSTSIYYLSYDASVFAGLRAGARQFSRELAGELWFQRRYNYLFQNELDGWSQNPTFDKTNVTLRLRVY